ncbi:MAG TPA: hypothetical protein PLP21_04845 [Pyrinomonadaceae bacterium]|nr:hypothetical protein [Acidobacteriota bacterium]HQZ95621.1 hypothetical protein [Pyrinomonadaceae bacterium]
MKRSIILVALFIGLTVSAYAQSGVISGKLVYPGDGIPRDMVLCLKVTTLYAEPVYCSNNKAAVLREAKISFKMNFRAATYEIAAPSGTYLLYGMTSEVPGHKAYYNEFVRCGMSVDCHSKKPIPVKVKPGQKVKGIGVGDFWE